MKKQTSAAEQLPLLSHDLPPLRLRDRVRVVAERYEGVIAQIWPGRDWYVVFSWDRGGPSQSLPSYRRDELELIEERRAA